jgi:hypothetical protein
MAEDPKVMVLGDIEDEHIVGDIDCGVGWCDTFGFPKQCACGGVIHASFGDEDWDGYWLYKKCDKCGETF